MALVDGGLKQAYFLENRLPTRWNSVRKKVTTYRHELELFRQGEEVLLLVGSGTIWLLFAINGEGKEAVPDLLGRRHPLHMAGASQPEAASWPLSLPACARYTALGVKSHVSEKKYTNYLYQVVLVMHQGERLVMAGNGVTWVAIAVADDGFKQTAAVEDRVVYFPFPGRLSPEF